jgi:gluconolactonase
MIGRIGHELQRPECILAERDGTVWAADARGGGCVAGTTGKRVTRLRVRPDGSLVDREVYGPSRLGAGLVDGIAFDAYGNLWATMIFADRLVAVTPEGDLLELMNDGDRAATARFEAAFAAGLPVPLDTMLACGGRTCTLLTSLAFGSPDLSTVYGLSMVHWS